MSNTLRIRLITLCLGLTAIAGAYQYSAADAMVSAADAFLKSLGIDHFKKIPWDAGGATRIR